MKLSPQLQQFVEDRVKAGDYTSADEMVEAAVARLMLDPEPFIDAETVAALDRADGQIQRGEYRDYSEVQAELRKAYLGGE